MDHLTKHLTKKEMKAMAEANEGGLEGVIAMELSDFIDNDLEGVLDIMSDKLTGTEVLGDINYEVVGHDGDTLFIKVSGDAEMILEDY